MDSTTLVLAVDSSQVNSAAAALDKMGVSGGRAETASTTLTRASAEQGKVLAGVLVPAAGKAAASVSDLASASKAIGAAPTSGINSTAAALSGEAVQAGKAALAFKDLAAAQAVLGARAARQIAAASGLNTLATEAVTAKKAVVDLSAASTTLGASSFERATTSLKATAAAALEAARSVIQLRDAEARTGSLATATTSLGAGGAAPAAASAGDAAAINALTSAAARADAQASTLANTLSRDLAAGATRAKASVADLSSATTSLGAASFVNFDKVTTSLGATATKAAEATREVNALEAATARLGSLQNVGTSRGAAVGPTVQTGGLRGAFANADAEERARRQQDPRLAAAPIASTTAAAGAAAGKAAGQFDTLGKSAKLAAFQQQQLGFQLHDFFVQVSSGGSPLTAFIQQGSQLSGTFGGAGNAFRALTSLITPMRLAMLGAAAAVGGLAVVLSRAESAARDLNTVQAQLAGTGRRDLFGTADLKAFIDQLAQAPGVTRETATAIVSEISKAHDIGAGLFRDLAGAAADYAKATGTDVPTAAKTLARAFSDPEKGARQLDDALGALSASQLLQIDRMVRQGNVAGAQRVLFDALQNSIRGLNDNAMTPLQRATNDLGNAWERAMQSLDKSQGLRTLNELLAKTVGFVAFLVNNADKLGGLGNAAVSLIPGAGLPLAAANAIKAQLTGAPNKNPTASGRVGGVDAPAAQGASAALAAEANASQSATKRALELASAYKSQASEVAALTDKRKVFVAELAKATKAKDPELAKAFKESIAGVDERIASIKKRGAGAGAGEAAQVLRAELQQDLKTLQDALAEERDAVQFHNRFLQGEFQAGNLSVREFYADKIATIEAATEREVATLEAERKRLEQYQRQTKDPSEKVQAQTRIDDIGRDEEKLRRDASNAVKLANQEQSASYKQLSEQVANYRANLLQLQGDEVGAARIRAEQQQGAFEVLARQSQGTDKPITVREVADNRQALANEIALTEAKRQTSLINERLEIEEERIALAQRTGALSENAALAAVGEARAKVVASLEAQLAVQEKIAETSKDSALLLNVERTRLEIDKLKDALDPLKEKFDNMFKDAGSSAIASFLNGEKTGKEALKDFGKSIATTINNNLAKELSDTLFSKGGIFGEAGSLFAGIFGGKKGAADAAKPALDTSAVSSSLTSLKTTGIDPTTSALTRLAQAADAAASSVGKGGASGAGLLSNNAATTLANSQPGDPLDNLIRNQGGFGTIPSGEQATLDLFKDAKDASAESARTTEEFGKSVTSAGGDVLKLALSATKGGSALSLLPSIISAISTAASASAAGGSGGGGIFGSILGLFSGGGGYSAADQAGLDALIATFHTGGVVGGPAAMKAVSPAIFAGAAKYHTGGTVLGGKAVPGLTSDEVPAILLKNEEVLTANDPRHRANIAPALLRQIEGGTVLNVLASAFGGEARAPSAAAGWPAAEAPIASPVAQLLRHDQQTREMSPLTRYLMGSPDTVKSLISELREESDFESVTKLRELHVAGNREYGGPVSSNSLYRVNERGPELLTVSGKQYLMTGSQSGAVTPNGGQGKGGDTHLHIAVTPPAGGDRASALQWGATAGRQIERANRRNG